MAAVYHGLSADDLAAELNVETTIDDMEFYRAENGRLSAEARQRLNGVTDIAYGPDPAEKLDVFAPEGAKDAPIIVDIHGGGWRAGTKDDRSFTAEAVNARGVIWVTIDYGLAPAYSVERIAGQARRAVQWTYDNIAQYGGDPERLFVSGNSAGGHLTGCCVMAGAGLPDGLIKGAAPMSGVFDMEALVHAAYGYNDELGMDLETARAYSPLHHLPAGGPPLIVAYGAPEPAEFRRQSIDFAAAWEKAGNEVYVIEVPETNHFMMSRQLADPHSTVHAAVMGMVGA